MSLLKVVSFTYMFIYPLFCFSQNGISIAYMRSIIKRGFRLDSPFTYDSFSVKNIEECIVFCAATQAICRSINFIEPKKICELNMMTVLEQPFFNINDELALYTDISQVNRNDMCSTKSCSPGEKCVMSGHEAICTATYSKMCPALTEVFPHAALLSPCNNSQNVPGTSCTWSCERNYKSLDGQKNGYMICLTSGEWSLSATFNCTLWIYDCFNVKRDGHTASGTYNLTLGGIKKVAYCDMTTEGGGWTVISKRIDGSENFKRNWNDYKYGFGNALGEYWIGNEYLYYLAWERDYDCYFQLQLLNGTWLYATFRSFNIGPETDGYRLKFHGYIGTAGNALNLGNSYGTVYDQMFSTFDRDQDISATKNIAKIYGGGWWYKYGAYAALTAPYNSNQYKWYNHGRLKYSSFMLRPHVH